MISGPRWPAGQGAGQRADAYEGPLYFVSSNTHSLVNIATGVAREREQQLIAFVESLPPTTSCTRS